jgi:uncharacterized integral membrane protein (TIGR00698 family)
MIQPRRPNVPGPSGEAPPPAAARQEPAATARLPATLVAVVGAVVCVPGVPTAAALAAGVVIALTVGNPLLAQTRSLAKRLLPLSVVGLGAGMDLAAVARTGAHGVGYTIATIAACAALGALVARPLRVDRRTGILVTVGTAICGGSAIAAAAPVIRADDHQISVSLATVFLLNSLALLVFPPLGRLAHLDEPAFGLWAALAIHDTSSVVGAALQYGPTALSIATTVKLARALWIVPVTVALAALERRRGGQGGGAGGKPPWFIVGFVVAAAIATYVPGMRPAGHVVALVAQRALVLTLFLIGLGLSRAALRGVGARPLLLGVALWIAMGTGTLAAIRLGLHAG